MGGWRPKDSPQGLFTSDWPLSVCFAVLLCKLCPIRFVLDGEAGPAFIYLHAALMYAIKVTDSTTSPTASPTASPTGLVIPLVLPLVLVLVLLV